MPLPGRHGHRGDDLVVAVRRSREAGITRLERGIVRWSPGSIRGGGERAAAEIAALRAQVATLTRELAAAAARERIEATGSVDAGDLPTKFSKFSRFDVSGRVRARGGGVLDALTASLGDGTTRFAFRRSGVGERNEGWAAPIVAGVALSLLFQAIDKIAAAASRSWILDACLCTFALDACFWTRHDASREVGRTKRDGGRTEPERSPRDELWRAHLFYVRETDDGQPFILSPLLVSSRVG